LAFGSGGGAKVAALMSVVLSLRTVVFLPPLKMARKFGIFILTFGTSFAFGAS
jgi:hypothetical protein